MPELELTKAERQARRKARREKKQTKVEPKLKVKTRKKSPLEFEGITGGTDTTLKPKKSRRQTIANRRKKIQRRQRRLKIEIDGKEKNLSKTSEYLLDMLIPETEE